MGTGENNIKNTLKLSNKKVIVFLCILIAVILAVVVIAKPWSKETVADMGEANTDMVTRGDVEVSITGSAAVEPNERYEIISMVSGDIISSPFDVGDAVNEGDILYQFDTSSTDISMEKQKLSLQQSEISYNNALEKAENLIITAPCSGVISGLNLKVGDEVGNGQQLANINNSRIMEVILPFNESQMSQIYVGASANVTSSTHMGIFGGEVIQIASVPQPQADGSKLYDVTIQFTNPGAITDGQTVGGEINGMISPGSGKVTYSETGTAKSEAEGTVSVIHYNNGDYVSRGDKLITLTSDTIEKDIKSSTLSYRNAQLSLREAQDKLDDYSISSPISGTVITKNSKAGDTIDKTNSTQTLMVVADVSKLKFELAIDELDVSKVTEGQTVEITCDALPDEMFYGTISKVSVEGTATNGVTTYSAQVVIDNPGSLRPSMNVDASVIVERAENVLRIPTSDIKTAMGRSFVFVKDDGTAKDDKNKGERPEGMQGERPEMPEGMEGEPPEGMPEGMQGERPEGMPEGVEGERPEGMPEGMEGERPEGTEGERPQRGGNMPAAPEGFKTVEIVIGVSGEDFTQVISGLNEGDLVYTQTVASSGNNMFGGFGGMGGGMPGGMGGGMPGGGMPGGMGGRR